MDCNGDNNDVGGRDVFSCRGGCLGDDKDVVIKYPGYHMERNHLTQTESKVYVCRYEDDQ